MRSPTRSASLSRSVSWRSGFGLLGTGAETAEQTVVGEALAPQMVQYKLELRRERDARDGLFGLGIGHPGSGQHTDHVLSGHDLVRIARLVLAGRRSPFAIDNGRRKDFRTAGLQPSVTRAVRWVPGMRSRTVRWGPTHLVVGVPGSGLPSVATYAAGRIDAAIAISSALGIESVSVLETQ